MRESDHNTRNRRKTMLAISASGPPETTRRIRSASGTIPRHLNGPRTARHFSSAANAEHTAVVQASNRMDLYRTTTANFHSSPGHFSDLNKNSSSCKQPQPGLSSRREDPVSAEVRVYLPRRQPTTPHKQEAALKVRNRLTIPLPSSRAPYHKKKRTKKKREANMIFSSTPSYSSSDPGRNVPGK